MGLTVANLRPAAFGMWDIADAQDEDPFDEGVSPEEWADAWRENGWEIVEDDSPRGRTYLGHGIASDRDGIYYRIRERSDHEFSYVLVVAD